MNFTEEFWHGVVWGSLFTTLLVRLIPEGLYLWVRDWMRNRRRKRIETGSPN